VSLEKNRKQNPCHSERSIAIGFINCHIKNCHSERSIAIGFINRNAESRNLLSLAAHNAATLRMKPRAPSSV
jgi:hypothetical protein